MLFIYPKKSEIFTQNIVEGQVILGCIQEVHDYELKVSLPHRLSGTVPITKISKAYTELVKKVGIWIRMFVYCVSRVT